MMGSVVKRERKEPVPVVESKPVTVVDAMSDPGLFGSWYKGASWDGWKAVLRGAFGLEMSEADKAFFRTVADREPPKTPVKEIWIAAGRRSGKDSVASLIAAHAAATFNKQHLLRPGERALILCLATDRQQAGICLGYIRAFFTDTPMLKSMIIRETADTLELSNGVDIQVSTASYRAVRGRAIAMVILDEIAFFSSEHSANPDLEIYRALLPGLSTLDGTLIAISSPYRRAGLLHAKYKQHFGRDSENVLFIKAATRTLNPSFDQAVIDKAMEDDAAAASAEYMGEFRSDISGWISLEVIEQAVDNDVTVRAPMSLESYVAFADPSGGVKDSFTLAVAHAEGGVAILDCVVEIKAPFSASEAVNQISTVLKSYGLKEVTGDRYAAGLIIDAFASCGITYKHSERDRSTIYTDALPMFSSGRIRLLDNQRLVGQLAALERKTSPGGRDKVDHPRGQKDDVANSACGALVLAGNETKKPTFFFDVIETRNYSRSNPGFRAYY
jgi:hypothetical protein